MSIYETILALSSVAASPHRRSALFLLAGVLSLALVPGQYGQESKPPPGSAMTASAPKPRRQPDVPFGATPQEAVEKMLELAAIRKGDVLYDLGCGEGRIVVTAARKYGIKAVGIDIDPQRVRESLANARAHHVEHLVRIIEGDLFATDFSEATVVTLFLGNDMNVRLMPQLRKLKPGTRILSFEFHMRGARPNEVLCGTRLEDGHEYTIYKWVVPWASE